MVILQDMGTHQTVASRIELEVPAIKAFGNAALVAAAQQAMLSLLTKGEYDCWLKIIDPAWLKHLKDNPGNIHAG